MYTYAFEKLQVWQEARSLVKEVYLLTKSYPDSEKFGLTSQMRRCAISICSNIAEGSARKTTKDQAHFYQMAYSSVIELLNQFILSVDLEFLEEKSLIQQRLRIENISRQIFNLRKTALGE